MSKNPSKAPAAKAAVKSAMEAAFAATYAAYFKAHSAHWNVRGPQFPSLHAMLEAQYQDLWEALDGVAERLRAWDLDAPSSLPAVKALPGGTRWQDLLADLLKAHRDAIATLREGVDDLAAAGDAAGADYLTGRLAEHEKAAWMISATLA